MFKIGLVILDTKCIEPVDLWLIQACTLSGKFSFFLIFFTAQFVLNCHSPQIKQNKDAFYPTPVEEGGF